MKVKWMVYMNKVFDIPTVVVHWFVFSHFQPMRAIINNLLYKRDLHCPYVNPPELSLMYPRYHVSGRRLFCAHLGNCQRCKSQREDVFL